MRINLGVYAYYLGGVSQCVARFLALFVYVTATQSRYEHGITRMQTCTIGMSMDADIKMRSRRRWKKGHVYIHNAKSVSEPLTRLPCPCNAVISVFRNGAVTIARPIPALKTPRTAYF